MTELREQLPQPCCVSCNNRKLNFEEQGMKHVCLLNGWTIMLLRNICDDYTPKDEPKHGDLRQS